MRKTGAKNGVRGGVGPVEPSLLGENLGAVGPETENGGAIPLQDGLDEPRGQDSQAVQAVHGRQPAEQSADAIEREGIGLGGGFYLDDRQIAGGMDREIVKAGQSRDRQARQQGRDAAP